MNKIDKLTNEELKEWEETFDKLQGNTIKKHPYAAAHCRLITFFLLDREPSFREFYKRMSKINFEDPFFYKLADELGNIHLELGPIVTEIERLWDEDFTGIQFDAFKKNYHNWYEKESDFYASLRKRIKEYLAKEPKNGTI